MKVLFVAAEGAPFIKTGGLADVIGSLPKELKKQGIEVSIMLPKYADMPSSYKEKMIFVKSLAINIDGRDQHFEVKKIKHNGITYYFICNEYYFNRPGVYGFADDGERFSFFCRASLAALPHIDFRPDIIHCHDWHTGMISLLLRAHYGTDPFYSGIGTVFTIHNLEYQGIFPRDILGAFLNLDDSYYSIDGVEFYGQVSFMKGGIEFSDFITTVSDNYREEIQTPFYGKKLEGLLYKRRDDLFGILNGIDYEEFNAGTDPHIFANYYKKSLGKKLVNKNKLQDLLGLPRTNKIPLMAMVSRLVSHKGLDLVMSVLDDIMALGVQLVILGTGEEKYELFFQEAANRYPGSISTNIAYDEKFAHQIYASSDMFLMPSLVEPCGLAQMIALRYGNIPIVRETGGLKDTVLEFERSTGAGNGFTFTNYDAQEMLEAIEGAVRLFHHKPSWTKIRKNAMSQDYSWKTSAKKYQTLYRELQGGRNVK